MTENEFSRRDVTNSGAPRPGDAAPDTVKNAADTANDDVLVSDDKTGVGSSVANDSFKVAAIDDKARVMGRDAKAMTTVALRFIIIVAALGLLGYLLRYIWVGLLPVILAILVAAVLFPAAAKLREWKFPRALASAAVVLGLLGVIIGTFTAMGPAIANQSRQLWTQAEEALNELPHMLDNLPFNVDAAKVDALTQDLLNFLQGQQSNIASGVMTGASMASSVVVALLIMLVILFFILKDGDKFIPWLRKYTGPSIGWHATELFTRIWRTLAGFIQAQAAVALVDAVFIGLGLWLLNVPLAFVLAVITFFASFVPIIGAVTAGALAVIIALVTNGFTNALLVLALIILVQQIEGNVLQPILQSRAMGLHAALVLLSVTVGSALAGIVGAFLAVPVAATITVVLRYHAEMISLRSGEVAPEDIDIRTGETGDDPDDSPRARVRQLYESMSPTYRR
ncbi:MAG: AI-2E family transporter [Corynebacterium sp.]|nr:AI-2E family transporter [Corynebacterium sp.]